MRTLLVPLFLALAACSSMAPDPMNRAFHGDKADASITLLEIEESTRNFADRYVQLLVNACDYLKSSATTQTVRREAHEMKLRSASSVFDIVTSSHPIQEMLDLMVQVELQKRIWGDEGRARKIFGEGGLRLIEAIESGQKEILSLAERTMKRRQIEEIQALMHDWRTRNPDVSTGAFMRFGPYLEAPGGTLVGRVLTGFGILNLSHLNPLAPAVKPMNQLTKTADDMFYMAKRFPMLLEWQAEAAVYDLSIAMEGLAKTSGGALEEAQSLAAEVGYTAESVKEAFVALEKITNPPKDPGETDAPKGRPFDITEYGATARDLTKTVDEARAMFQELQALVESPAVTRRISEVKSLSSGFLLRLFGEAVLLLAIFFAMLIAYRVISHRMDRPKGARPRA